MARLAVQTEFGSLYARFRVELEAEVDPDNLGEIEAKAAELFKRTTAGAQQAVDDYNAEVERVGKKALEATRARRGSSQPRDKPTSAGADEGKDDTPRCSECGGRVTNQKVVDFSQTKYGKIVCFECQRTTSGTGQAGGASIPF